MAKAKKRVSTRAKSAKRRKASAKLARKKTAKRAAPKKAKSKVRPTGKIARKPPVKKQAPKTVPRKLPTNAPMQMAEVPLETTIIDVIEEPVPGVVVVTEFEEVRTGAPILSDRPKRGTGPGKE